MTEKEKEDKELDDAELDENVSGGFNPQPEPPAKRFNPKHDPLQDQQPGQEQVIIFEE